MILDIGTYNVGTLSKEIHLTKFESKTENIKWGIDWN